MQNISQGRLYKSISPTVNVYEPTIIANISMNFKNNQCACI